jgi:UDP-glucose 4-epimerase
VYGNPEVLPITEEHPTGNVTNVYGRTKYFIEEMLKDISAAEKVKLKSICSNIV